MAGEDAGYLNWIRSLPCIMCDAAPPNHAHHHTRRRGVGQRANDLDAMPLCMICHEAFHWASGPFKGWAYEQRRRWQDACVESLQKTWGECF